MTEQEAITFQRIIQACIDVKGQCKVFSVARCECALCQIGDIDPVKVMEEC